MNEIQFSYQDLQLSITLELPGPSINNPFRVASSYLDHSSPFFCKDWLVIEIINHHHKVKLFSRQSLHSLSSLYLPPQTFANPSIPIKGDEISQADHILQGNGGAQELQGYIPGPGGSYPLCKVAFMTRAFIHIIHSIGCTL